MKNKMKVALADDWDKAELEKWIFFQIEALSFKSLHFLQLCVRQTGKLNKKRGKKIKQH